MPRPLKKPRALSTTISPSGVMIKGGRWKPLEHRENGFSPLRSLVSRAHHQPGRTVLCPHPRLASGLLRSLLRVNTPGCRSPSG